MRTFRNPALRWVAPITVLGAAVVAWTSGSAVAAVLIMGTWLMVVGLTDRVRVEADAQHVRVVNYLRTTVLSWGEVAAVDVDPARARCVLRLRSGSALTAWGLNAGPGGLGAAEIVKAVNELETLRARYRGPRVHHPRARVAARGAFARARPMSFSSSLVLGALLTGLALLGGGAYLLAQYAAFAEHGVPVEAVVTAVSGFKYADVTLRYTVDGQTLVNTAGDWNDWPHVGQTVAAVYDSTNPSQITDARVAGTLSTLLEAVWVLVIGAASLTYAAVKWLRGPWY